MHTWKPVQAKTNIESNSIMLSHPKHNQILNLFKFMRYLWDIYDILNIF